MSEFNIFLVGAGGHALSIASVLALDGVKVNGYFSDEISSDLDSIGVLHFGNDERLFSMTAEDSRFLIGLGFKKQGTSRSSLISKLEKAGFTIFGFISTTASISSFSSVSDSAQLLCQSYIGPKCRIGDHVVINTNAVVEHHVEIGAGTHIAPGATICGGVSIGSNSEIGANATVLPGVSIGDSCIVGAGAVVVDDIPSGSRFAGVPAREI